MGTPHLVSPRDFTLQMERHWTETLGNASSDQLRGLWSSLATAFGHAILSHGHAGLPQVWRVLNPPTGTGKTQGTCVYAAMLAKANRRLRETQNAATEPVGMLIVTRLISEANALAEAINSLAGFPCAVASHSESKVSTTDRIQADVLVVTHQAYVNALEGFTGSSGGPAWSDMVNTWEGPRKLTVIDETLANVVESHQLTSEAVRQVLAHFDPDLRSRFPSQFAALQQVDSLLNWIAQKMKSASTREDRAGRVIWRSVNDGVLSFPEGLSMKPVREAMSNLRYDHVILGKDSPLDRRRIADRIDQTLASVEGSMSRWAYYAKIGREHSFNSARLLIPDTLPAPVVLDATATQQVLWELLGEDRAVIQPIPSGARNYSRVTLHVARATGLGKGKMTETAAKRIPRVLRNIEGRDGGRRRVFLCCHKDVEHVALSYAPDFEEYSVGHWGAVDGRNDWKDCDTAVIVGLQYFDRVWSTNVFFALQGLQDNQWLREPKWKHYPDVRREMQIKQLTTSLVQAINRIRCRRVIDGDGNCPDSEVFLLLPKGDEGDSILSNIREEMPDIAVVPWNLELDGETVQVRKGSSHEALIAFMRNRLPGETAMTAVQKALGLGDEGRKTLAVALRDPAHPLTKALADIGVRYVSTGVGRGSKSYLVKALPGTVADSAEPFAA